MSLFRSSKLHNITSRFQNLRERLVPGSRKSAGQMKPRRLLIDPLEERQLLSLSPADWDDNLVNQTFNESSQFTLATESVAADNDGDFVVTWTRYDPVLDANGRPVIDPATGDPITDANIYARYFTDEVQRLTLPDEIVANNSPGQYGTFSLIYGGSEVQKIEFSATHEPLTSFQDPIEASVTFGFDNNGNGHIDANETATVPNYNELDLLQVNAAKIETALQGIGGTLNDVSVTPINPKEFLVNFGDLSFGINQPEITIENVAFTRGFLPAVLTSTVREPIVIGPIVVSPDNPQLTARSIETSFFAKSEDIVIGPINFPPQDDNRLNDLSIFDEGPNRFPDVIRTPLPGVSVRPIMESTTLPDGTVVHTPSLTQFDLIFDGATGPSEGASGKKDHPELLFSAVADDLGVSWLGSPQLDVTTMKEPSPEFRVNPAEPEDPFTAQVDKTDQTNPVVAMDADGDFVITWQSIIPEWQDHSSLADIFARQFSPVGTVDPADVDFVPSVWAGETFQVNTITNTGQAQPSVDMDDAGNFTIAWATGSQDLSFFNGIKAQMYNRDGEPVGGEFLVNSVDTSYHLEPSVGMSNEGDIVISWTETDDEDYVLNGRGIAGVNAKVYNPDGNVLFNQFAVGVGGGSAIAFDSENNYVITRHGSFDADRVGGTSLGVEAVMRQLYDAQGNLSNAVIRDEFRANSSEYDTTTNPLWPGPQYNGQPALDADGDLVIMYEGYGPEVSDRMATYYEDEFQQALVDLFYQPKHSDLLLYYDPAAEGLPISSWYQDANGFYRSVSSDQTVGGQIDQILLRAINQGATDVQVGRISALLNQVAGLLRGEANGILFSSWDDDSGSLNRLYSDNVANAHRDGENARYILTINRALTTGASFGIYASHPLAPGYTTAAFTATYTNAVLNVGTTRTELERFLQGMQHTGDTWEAPGGRSANQGGPGTAAGDWSGTVEVRVLQWGTGFPDDEISTRQGTGWDLSGMVNPDEAVFEITFIGETHDLPFYLSRDNPTNVQPTGAPAPRIFEINQGDSGVNQTAPSIAMEPDGDFVAVWTQNEKYTSGAYGSVDFTSLSGSNQNIYFRRFDEEIDHAGPRMTDLVNTNGERVASGDFIDGEVRHIVIPFDEELMAGDPTQNPDSVLNPRNFRIYRGDVEIPLGVAKAEFGMNKAADLAGTADGLGGTYNLSPVPTNKWEVVLTLDADGLNGSGIPALRTGAYTIVPQAPRPADGLSGLRDMAGNALGFTGYQPAGRNFSWDFVVRLSDPDVPITYSGGGTLTNGTTHPETPGAVAMDADGDHVVVWTAYDSVAGHDRVYMRMLDADGSPADLVLVNAFGQPMLDLLGNMTVKTDAAPAIAVTPFGELPGQFNQFRPDIQRHGNVAMDDDGDFIITWTNYRDGNADIYARRFDSRGEIAGITESGGLVFKSDVTEAFRVNNYTDNQQKWSDVAMDLDGDFVVTWSSYGQEDNGQLGRGYGVYARQYDSTGQPLAPEFQVNVTTGGNQFSSSVAMAANAVTTANSASSNADAAAGDFVIVWTSDQNGIGMDIVAREFSSDGSPKVGPLSGEIVMNDMREGDQTHPDVAMRLDGETYVVTWTDSAQDGSGNSVFAELSAAVAESFVSLVETPIINVHNLTINVGRGFTISDVDIQLGILTHMQLEDVQIELIHGGVTVLLFSNLPRPLVDGSRPPGGSMIGTRFDQGADMRIIDSNGGAVPSYPGMYVPEGNLDAFNTLNAGGGWTLRITDIQPQNNLTGWLEVLNQEIGSWRLIIEDENGVANSFQVNSTQAGHQLYSAAAMDYQGNFTITWSGKGSQPFQQDTDGYGVFYQRYDEFAARLGLETRANRDTAGDQWMSSIASDAVGNFALAWTGTGSLPNSTQVYTYASVNDIPRPDAVGPVVTDVLFDGVRVASGDFLVPGAGGIASLKVVFNEEMSVDGGADGLNSILNVDNWFLSRNNSQIVGAITDVAFELNPVTNKYEAVITFDGNGVNFGTPSLLPGDYSLAIRDLATDVSVLGNSLDGDIDGIPGSSPFQLGLGGYRHQFYVSDVPQIGAEMRINPEETKQYEQRFTAAGGVGYAREESNRTVGVDHDGDFVVVWTSYGQDDAGDSSGAGVYMRMYDRNNNPLTPETSVNGSTAINGQKYIQGDQRNATVAMDADGEFVVVWESEGQDPDGSWGVYGKRYNSVGVAQIDPAWEMVQRLAFDTVGVTTGVYTLKIGDATTESIAFDSSDPAGSATAIQTAIFNLTDESDEQLYPYVVVSLASGTNPYAFDIRFAGDHGGEVHPTIEYIPGTVAASVLVSDASDDRYIFRINSEITGNQLNPSVGMDDFGNFVVVWATAGQDFSFFNDVYGQRYNRVGERLGLEFLVNTNDLPGTNPPPGGSFEINPAVAMSGSLGSFVVAWDVVIQHQNGAVLNSVIAARRFGADGLALAAEFQADTAPGGPGGTDTERVARNPQLAVDDQGGFIVVWESHSGVAADGYDVYYRQFPASGGGSSAMVNMGQFDNHQVNPSVGIDADGDFTMVWNGNGAEPDPLFPGSTDLWTDRDNRGVFTRSYHASVAGVAPSPVAVQSRVNRTEVGYQEYPSVGVEPDGDKIVVWSGRGVGDHHGIFVRRYDEPTDTAGPRATELRLTDGTLIQSGFTIEASNDDYPEYLVVVLDEDMWMQGVDSVENVDSWELMRGQNRVIGGITQVQFGLNKSAELGLPGAVATNKWEAVLTLDGDSNEPGIQPFEGGNYTLTALRPVADVPETPVNEGHSGLRDAVGNPLGRTGLRRSGADQSFPFAIRFSSDEGGDIPVVDVLANARTYAESPGAVAVDADGDHVAVFTATDGATGLDRVYVRMFQANGSASATRPGVFAVTTEPEFANDDQRFATVAIDADGDFVVTWTNYRDGNQDIYARRFDSAGQPQVNGAGYGQDEAFRVNNYTANNQKWSRVAMDVDGDFVVTWSSYGQEDNGQMGTGYGIYARQFDSFGYPRAPEFQVNVTTGGDQQISDVVLKYDGTMGFVWTSDQNGVGDDIIVRFFDSDGAPWVGPLGGELLANNQITAGNQRYPDIDMSMGAQFVVTWTGSAGEDSSGSGVYAQVYDAELLEIEITQQVPSRTAYTTSDVGQPIFFEAGVVRSTMVVTDAYAINDVNVTLNINHNFPDDLKVELVSPSGTVVKLFDYVPDPFVPGASFINTVLDDETTVPGTPTVPINVSPAAGGSAAPPFTGTFSPEGLLSDFDGENVNGTWELRVTDIQNQVSEAGGTLVGWVLEVQRVPARSGEILVNTTQDGNQMFSSVAMDTRGDFTVAWSGYGDQEGQEDRSQGGVYYQRFNERGEKEQRTNQQGEAVDAETRLNFDTTGRQWLPSIGADAHGNNVIVWTGDAQTGSGTDVYRLIDRSESDDVGPLVTDVLLIDGTRIMEGDALISSTLISELVVTFSEDLSIRVGQTPGEELDSVLGVSNWILERNGTEILNGVTEISSFGRNPATGKYEAVLQLDANGLDAGTPALTAGNYVLTATDAINDAYNFVVGDPFYGGNSLDGDFDGVPGTSLATSSQPGFQRSFTVGSDAQFGAEFRLNPEETKGHEQRFLAPAGIGQAREESTRSVGVDHDGDFVVVWTSYGQDDAGDTSGAGVYMRMYDRNNNPMTEEVLVNGSSALNGQDYIEGHQRNATVAMDADGEFVVVWESEGQDADGSWGVYGKRYNSVGVAQINPEWDSVGNAAEDKYIFRVNTEITGNQLNPAVGMDDSGNFVVVWATAGQDFGFFNDVFGQRYNRLGERQGLEFRVNTDDLPGTNPPPPAAGGPGGSFEINPAVAMSGSLGNFVVAWDLVTAQQNGAVVDSVIAARMYGGDGGALGAEFQADTSQGTVGGLPGDRDTQRVARNPQLVMDDQGGFILVWESHVSPAVGYDVFYQQWDASGATVADAQVNMAQFTGEQVNPSVAMDADGDFTVVWNGNGAEPNPLNPGATALWADGDNRGVFARSYHASAPGVAPSPVTVQSRVNRTEVGFQEHPTIGMEPDGDRIVVWSGRGVGDSSGIFARRFDEPTDTAGPRATELRLGDGRLVDQTDSISQPDRFVVVFDEDLWTTGPDSVENVDNWVLTRDLVELENRIVQVQFGLNKSYELGLPGAVKTNKWEAVVTLDGNPGTAGLSPLPAGGYTLIVRHPVPDVPETESNEGQSGIRDAVGNPIRRTGFNPSGNDDRFSFTVSRTQGGTDFSVTNGRTYPENRGAVAMDGDGDHVVALTATDGATGLDRVFVRIFDADGGSAATNPNLFPVTSEPEFVDDEQRNATVATDADGDFVVTWTNFRDGDEDVYARRFFADGTPMGPSFRLNTYTNNIQTWSDVVMDDDGDFVATWSSYAQETNGQLGSGWGVYARQFDSFGEPQAPEFLVNVTTAGNQRFSSVAMSSDGGFIIAWTSDQNGVGDDIVARLFKPDGSAMISPLAGEIMINDTTAGNQKYPDVAMTPSGANFVVTWTSTSQDGSGDGIYGQFIDVPLLLQGNVPPVTTYVSTDVPKTFGFGSSITSTLSIPSTFPDNFSIADIDLIVDIRHGFARDVVVSLVSPSGTTVRMFENVPRIAGPASDFLNTRLNDEAVIPGTNNPLSILDATGLVTAPFTNLQGYVPQEPLNTFDGQISSGTWQIFVQDTILQSSIFLGNRDVGGQLVGWSLDLTRVPSRSGEFLINETTVGNQSFSSVTMNRQGAYTVVWSGQGDRENEEDQSASGVFYRRFAFGNEPLPGPQGEEKRANVTTDGNQRFASVDTDGEGNFAIVWTGEGAVPGTTDVYRFLSTDVLSVRDVDGPRVSDILVDNARVVEGDVLGTNVTSMTVNFSEDLSLRDDDIGLDAIANPANWILQRNGSEVPGVITGVSFGLNPATRKYEAVLTFDGNGADSGDLALLPGDYVLTVRDAVNDTYSFSLPEDSGQYFLGNSLDGDFDGSPGTMSTGSGEPGFRFQFSVAGEPRLGPEFRVNQNAQLVQRISTPLGTGFAREEGTSAVAVDHDGDFAVVWTSYGQDAAGGAGVYLRLYDRDDNPLTDEIPVNTTVAGDQRNATVAVDADGELVVAWQSDSQDPDGSSGIYARRFDSVGRPLSGEFRVNLNTTDSQFSPAAAMDNSGNFVIVWGTASQAYSLSNDIRGQRFNYKGHRLGGEFLVNDTNLPGVGGQEVNPAVAMDDEGNFVVAWDQITAQQNGAVTDSQIIAKMFDSAGVALGPEFVADTAVGAGGGDIFRTARNPQVTMDDQGGFIVVWEAHGPDDNGPDSFGVFFQEFDNTGVAVADGPVNYGEIDANLALAEFAGHQVNASVAVDANGDFAVVFNGVGATADPLDPTNSQLFSDVDEEGVFIRHFDTTDTPIDVQSRVNRTETGIQHFATIGMEPDGDHLVVWAGAGAGDRHGIFARRYNDPTDSVGPIVSDLTAPSGDRIQEGSQVSEALPFIIVTFDEDMATSGPESVTRASNYSLLVDGSPVLGMIKDTISYGLNRAYQMGLTSRPSNKWEAVLQVDGNGANLGEPTLPEGDYELIVKNTVRDAAGNPLGSVRALPNGSSFSRQFNVMGVGGGETRVNTSTTGTEFTESPQTVASDADGDTVTVWVNRTAGQQGIYAKLSDVIWTVDGNGDPLSTIQPGAQILVTGDQSAMYPSVAVDGDGDFVVTWSQMNSVTSWDVYARRYDAQGKPLAGAFMVNSETENIQQYSTVAMDQNGDFVITWQSFDQDGDGWGIYAQRYNPAGLPLGGRHEVQVLNFVGNPTGTFRLQWLGNPTTPNVTGNIGFSGDTFAVASLIRDELAVLGAEVEVDVLSQTEVSISFVGTNGAKDQDPISVASQSVTGDSGAHVAMSTAVEGSSGEFLVNDTTANNQQFPAVAMDAEGNFVISWTAYGQDGDAAQETNVYAKQFPRNEALGGSTVAPNTSAAMNPILDGIVEPLYLGVQAPDAYLVPDGSGFDGVAMVFAGPGMGSGALLSTGIHVLTAAHVVEGPIFSQPLPTSLIDVIFYTPTGVEIIPASSVIIHPDWNGDVFNGADVAIITLAFAPSIGVERYDIYRESDEVGQTTEKYGFGNTGQGNTGQVPAIFDGLRRGGLNRWDSTGGGLLDTFSIEMSDGVLMYDFDNGLAANDAFGQAYGIHDLGYGNLEVGSAQGDSGGPTFIDGKIAGVTSFGMINLMAPQTDVTAALDFSFGELRGDARVSSYAEWIDEVTTFGPEFLVNQTVVSDQSQSAVAMDADGDFVITWTSYGQDGVGTGYGAGSNGVNGVFARRFSGSAAVSDEFQVNTYAEGNQETPRVAMDADGDFVVTWDSHGQDGDGSGIFAQRFARNQRVNEIPLLDNLGFPVFDINGNLVMVLDDPLLGPAGQIGGEFAVNTTALGDQSGPGIGMDDTGDFVIVWSGNGEASGQADSQGIFEQRFEKPDDEAGPTVTDIYNVRLAGGSVELGQLVESPSLDETVSQFVVMFGENPSMLGLENGSQSVVNPFNWELTKDGVGLAGGVVSVEFGLNRSAGLTGVSTGKYEAIVTFDGDPGEAGLQALGQGRYVLTARDAIEDMFENRLDGNLDGTPGDDFGFAFNVFSGLSGSGGPGGPGDAIWGTEDARVNSIVAGEQEEPAIASNADGAYVVVWTKQNLSNQFPFPWETVEDTDVVAQRYNRFGQKEGYEFLVASFPSSAQGQPDVAMDRFGNFVVTWSGQGEDDTSGVFARVFDSVGNPLSEQFRVNQTTVGTQESPKVTMDGNGEFVVSWTDTHENLTGTDIYVRRYNNHGQAKSGETLVNSTTGNHHETSDVAMDADGNFVVIWAAMGQDESSLGVFGQRFNAAGNRLGGEFRVNAYGHDKQFDPQIAMDPAGKYVVTWSSFLQDGSGWGVFARRFSSTGAGLGGEFRVSQTTLYSQHESAVSMDDDGNFVITWNGYNQEGDTTQSSGIFARMFNADGTDYVDPGSGEAFGEFRINAVTEGEQTDPAVAMDADGDFTVVWVGLDSSGTGIYHRIVAVNGSSYTQNAVESSMGGYTGRFLYAAPAGVSETVINGTAGDDVFEVEAGPAPGAWTVKLNGVVQDVVSGADSVAFDGKGGDDTVNLVSLAPGNDSAELWPDHGTFTSAGVTFTLTDVDSINIDGGAGEDSVIIHDSANDDMLVARAATNANPVSAISITDPAGSSYSHTLANFEIMAAYSTGGIDTAKLYDSDGDDKFVSDSDANLLKGDGFSLRAKNFQFNHAYSLNGGDDLAEFHDTEGQRDRFKGYSTYSKMFRGLHQRRAKGFETVVAYATPGDNDDARFFDSKENDQFIASPTESRMFSAAAGYDITARAFDSVLARANSGGFDTAAFIGGPGDDLLLAKWVSGSTGQTSPKTIMMDRDTNGNVYEITARKFDRITAQGDSEGWDVAKFWDTVGDDRFVADGDRAAMYGPDNDLLYDVMAFDQVNFNRGNGGIDTTEKGSVINFKLVDP